jgi:hypothetical protein
MPTSYAISSLSSHLRNTTPEPLLHTTKRRVDTSTSTVGSSSDSLHPQSRFCFWSVVLPKQITAALVLAVLSTGCVSTPTLVQVARERQLGDKNAIRGDYHITDRDVLDFSDKTKRKLSSRFDRDRAVRLGSSSSQLTLGGLAGAASTFGWAASTASGLGLGATYIFGLGQIFDSKGHAEAYERAFTEIQRAEADYYFHQLGMKFAKDAEGKRHPDFSNYQPNGSIPSGAVLTIDGETLFYRVSKIMKVLNDVLASKIPDLQDMKDAEGDKSASSISAPTR